MASLQEQLMKSGLINKQKAQQAQTEKRRKAHDYARPLEKSPR